VYESIWYDLTPSQTRDLFLMIVRSQKHLAITVGKVTDISLMQFTSVRLRDITRAIKLYTYCSLQYFDNRRFPVAFSRHDVRIQSLIICFYHVVDRESLGIIRVRTACYDLSGTNNGRSSALSTFVVIIGSATSRESNWRSVNVFTYVNDI